MTDQITTENAAPGGTCAAVCSQRYFDCKVCGRHMTRMIDPDGRLWIQADRTLPEGGLDYHTSGVYCPNCIPRSMEAGWQRAMSLRASRVANPTADRMANIEIGEKE